MSKEKKLPKVTNYDHLSTIQDITTYLNTEPNDSLELLKELFDRYNDSIQNDKAKDDYISKMILKVFKYRNDEYGEINFKNSTYEANHHIITSFIHNHILENNCFPPTGHIAHKTGLSRQTIYKHLKTGLKNKYNTLITGKMEYMATHALSKLYLIGITQDNATALKSFIELSSREFKKQPSNSINNYIQINNLKISKEEFNQLPNDTILKIEKLISMNLS
ncbi:hypothetical protein [Maribacter aquivivus]|uniref:hypothetical protein n=1 Tax=Maribacter aquivivus TaxID=228958 RepID=UPI002495057F|nr:hypothetical protein [Maribacter aquivivus]